MYKDISKLIKEAKPLYFSRKKKRKQLVGGGSVLVACLIFALPFIKPENQLYIYEFSEIDHDINMTQNGSAIEDMGFPTDEYGLLRIS